jgi:hypothetical protein
VRLHHRWDDDEVGPDLDPADSARTAAMIRASRDLRIVKLIHLALVALGMCLLALALLLRMD